MIFILKISQIPISIMKVGGETSKYGKSSRNVALYNPIYHYHQLLGDVNLGMVHIGSGWGRIPDDAKILDHCVERY